MKTKCVVFQLMGGVVFSFFFFKFRWIKKIGELNICGVVWMGVAFL